MRNDANVARAGNDAMATKDWDQSITNFFLLLSTLFFLSMLVFPTVFQIHRGLFLALLVALAIVAAGNRWSVSRDLLLLWLLTMIVGAIGILWGVINGAPGALRVSTVHIVWPCVYLLFIGMVRNPQTIVRFEKMIVVGVVLSSLMALALLLGAVTGHAQTISTLLSFQGAGIGLYDGYVELTLYNLATVIYGLPFLAALFFLPRDGGWLREKVWVGFSLLLVLLVCVVSGRRAFWLLAAMTPLLLWVLFVLAGVRAETRLLIAAAVTLVVLAITVPLGLDVEIRSIGDQFLRAFDFSGEQSAGIRAQQFSALITGWSESPVIGQGLGATEKTIIRSHDMPWAYELSYAALLFQSGLLGVFAYSFAVLWVFYAGLRIVRHKPETAQIVLPLVAGLAGFLLVNATNPYLTKFDFLWTIFLPVAAINAYSTKA